MTRHTRNRQMVKATGDRSIMSEDTIVIVEGNKTNLFIDNTFEWWSTYKTDDEFGHFVTFAPKTSGFFRVVDVK